MTCRSLFFRTFFLRQKLRKGKYIGDAVLYEIISGDNLSCFIFLHCNTFSPADDADVGYTSGK